MAAHRAAGSKSSDLGMVADVDKFAGRLTFMTSIALRVALAAGFLSAIADRFGLWGKPGTPGVAWGDWSHFLIYTSKLNWFLPSGLVPAAGAIATFGETVLAVLLLANWRPRHTALTAGALLLLFALAMTFASGIKPPLDYSVYTAAAAAFYLAATSRLHSVRSSMRT